MITAYIILLAIIAFVILKNITSKTKIEMPILSITEQPLAGSLHAAYRPIIFTVAATRTDNAAEPPLVYCDVYVRGQYHKTITKTQYDELMSDRTIWRFDIREAILDVFESRIGENGSDAVADHANGIANVYCKFRSSGLDLNGFIQPEGTAPKQGTGKYPPVAGTGTVSNDIVVVNATLQHENNQSLAAHLNHYKTGTWNAGVFPLSHRSSASYKVCESNSDFFPILNLSDKSVSCLRIKYKAKGSNSIVTLTNCQGCVPVSLSGPIPATAMTGQPYNGIINLSGSAPFSITEIVKPDWMNVSLSGNKIIHTGTPTTADLPSVPGGLLTVDIISGGGSYTNGTYHDVTVTTGSGNGDGAKATVVITGMAITGVTITTPGQDYAPGDLIFILNGEIGGTGNGSNIKVATVSEAGGSSTVSYMVSNECGSVAFEQEVEVEEAVCIKSAFGSATTLPNATVGEPYNFSVLLTGSQPFTLSGLDKPDWMSVSLNGDTISVTGTPTAAGTAIEVFFIISNCHSEAIQFNQSLTVEEAPAPEPTETVTVENTSAIGTISFITVNGQFIPFEPNGFPIETGQTAHSEAELPAMADISVAWTNSTPGIYQRVRLFDSWGAVGCASSDDFETYTFTGVDTTGPSPIKIILQEGVC